MTGETLSGSSLDDNDQDQAAILTHKGHDYGTENTEDEPSHTVAYKRRWYLQLLIILNGLVQGLGFNTWGPITASATSAFGWDNADVAMMPNWSNIAYVTVQMPVCWFLTRKGLRWMFLASCGCLVLSSGLRCLPFDPLSAAFKWSVFSGQILNGCVFIFIGSGSTLFSNTWFPPNQRTLSTSLTTTAFTLGSALSFIVGPLVVSRQNVTTAGNTTYIATATPNDSETSAVLQERTDILHFLHAQLIASAVLFLTVLVYFPARPPTAPSLSAQAEREEWGRGLRVLCKQSSFWLLVTSFSCLGLNFAWPAVLNIDMAHRSFTQVEIGYLGFWAQIASIIAVVPLAWLSAVFAGRLKMFMFISMLLTTVFFILFTSMNQPIIGLPSNLGLTYAATIGSAMFVPGLAALYLELFCEMYYPVSEDVIGGLVSVAYISGAVVFLLIYEIPGVGTMWADWVVVGTSVLSLVCLLLVKAKYNRSGVDTKVSLLPQEESLMLVDD